MVDTPNEFPGHGREDPAFGSASRLLAAIIDSSDDAIVSKNLQGVVLSWNRGAERIFGYTALEMIGTPITKLIPPERGNEEPQILERLKKGERVDHFESVRLCKNGSRIDVSLTISPIRDDSGRIVGISKIARDISGQKRAMQRLAAVNDELQRANRIKAEFVTTLSHELRTPLNAIVGWLEILKDGPVGADELAEGLRVIERNARIQTRMIEDLLDMSRIESGKITLDMQPIELAPVVELAIESVRPTAAAKQIQLTRAFSESVGTLVADRDRVQQIIWNLLTNAIKFTPKRGRVHVTIERDSTNARIAVADSGEGVDPTMLDQIFERFRQANASSTRRHGGLGLGLSITKHLVELHGGEIHASSDGQGCGTTISVTLPLEPVPGGPRLPAPPALIEGINPPDADLSSIRVLVVDDDPDSLTVLRRILESRQADVRTAASMDAALNQVSAFGPEIILSDISMPDHDGYELLARLRQMPEGRSTPVVAVTAQAQSGERTRALLAGFQMHLSKPVNTRELVAVVANFASLRRQSEPPQGPRL